MYFGLPEPLYTIGEHDEAGSGCACFLLVPPEPTVASTRVPVTATRNATRRRVVTRTSSFETLGQVVRRKYPCGGGCLQEGSEPPSPEILPRVIAPAPAASN